MSVALHQDRSGQGLYIYAMADTPWSPTTKPGARQKVIRADPATGCFLGLMQFDPMLSSGVHQHLGVATSLMMSGSLGDYQESYAEGDVTINLAGATHDAITWNGCMFAARLEGPVVYLPDETLSDAHIGAQHASFRNPDPETPPALAGQLSRYRQDKTGLQRLSRRMLYDYGSSPDDHRFVELTLWPEMSIPTHRTTALTEWLVLAGGAVINNQTARQGSFVVMEPETEVTISSPFGCRLLAWADGPVQWSDGAASRDVYGF